MRARRWGSACLLVLAGCANVVADPSPDTNQTPVSVVATEPEPTIVVAPVPPAPDPTSCMDGMPFVKTPDGFICASRYHPLVPMTIAQMVAAVGLPPIFTTTIIPRESRDNPGARNRYDCRGLTQHCAKAGYYERRGYIWDDAFNPWVHLLVTKDLYDEQGLAPWRCSRCSLRS